MSKNTLRNLGKICADNKSEILLIFTSCTIFLTVLEWDYYILFFVIYFISSLSISSSNIKKKKNILFAVFIPCY